MYQDNGCHCFHIPHQTYFAIRFSNNQVHTELRSCISPKEYATREEFHVALTRTLKDAGVDLIVLAGYLVAIPEILVKEFPNKIINIHPSLIPSFCGVGY